ncbi:MAG: PorP/SprF family type IX secretion system membrane protein [Flavobacteriia bacterium]|nr:PorP/SprF family type IX secretion system membrane protein [Flavobacteriia bacterium]
MNKRVLLFATLLILNVSSLMGQQDKLLTHFIYDKMSLNPGSTGIDIDGICATSVYRNQWDRVNGAPNSAILNVEANMKRWMPGGLGLSFYHDAIGFYRQNNVVLNYSYPIVFENGSKLGLGLGLGLTNLGLTPEWVPPTSVYDKSLPVGFSGSGLDLNIGAYFKSNSGFYVGASLTHANAQRLNNKLSQTTQLIGFDRHYYLMGGYKRTLGSGNNAIDVQMLVRSILSETSVDLNARFMLGTLGYAGLSFRNSDAVALMLGYNVAPGFLVGYSYDFTINKLSSISRGSHEIVIKYCRPIPLPPIAISRHPRWL